MGDCIFLVYLFDVAAEIIFVSPVVLADTVQYFISVVLYIFFFCNMIFIPSKEYGISITEINRKRNLKCKNKVIRKIMLFVKHANNITKF